MTIDPALLAELESRMATIDGMITPERAVAQMDAIVDCLLSPGPLPRDLFVHLAAVALKGALACDIRDRLNAKRGSVPAGEPVFQSSPGE